ncbi:hypothetical protein PPERSA_08926 [Pseudocohnilembus persalinus]|uniref:Uncharacterized protein n=1 Tax=Pseudocohnilembus persalinus TaxID=266149 RepID=A0A0V0R2T8_PSEPJ|nr:hypothetical protein PPERSA_08926 [Pseudocohnilembus persalinus]|eukprot:KRX08822.1 hypothetical protein PPERSA_08926 [Pseudocohnilembus persalinus]
MELNQQQNQELTKQEQNLDTVQNLEQTLDILQNEFDELNQKISKNLQKKQTNEYCDELMQAQQKLEKIIMQCEGLVDHFPQIEQLCLKVQSFREKVEQIEKLKEKQLMQMG